VLSLGLSLPQYLLLQAAGLVLVGVVQPGIFLSGQAHPACLLLLELQNKLIYCVLNKTESLKNSLH
jgi:hypothetical protein